MRIWFSSFFSLLVVGNTTWRDESSRGEFTFIYTCTRKLMKKIDSKEKQFLDLLLIFYPPTHDA